jgi:RNA polymerase sigma-70 factor (ECF subfamily)
LFLIRSGPDLAFALPVRWSGVWQTASCYQPDKGSAMAWAMTIAHRRAVDRVRAEQSRADRTYRVGQRAIELPYDEVVEEVHARLERETVRRGLGSLTQVQREAITLAYYGATPTRRWPSFSTYRWARSRPGSATA